MATQEGRLRGFGMRWPTRVMGVAAVGVAATFLGAELIRIWRLGSLPEQAGAPGLARGPRRFARIVRIAREGYKVSRTRRNAVFNMLVAFMVTLASTRAITVHIRSRGGIGPFRNVQLGTRHIHHFVPGVVVCLISGGVALGSQNQKLRPWLAIPFGGGAALIIDETALLLELEDVYWSEEGVLSLQVGFAAIALLAVVAYGVQFLRLGTSRVLEADWQAAARAWGDLRRLSGGG